MSSPGIVCCFTFIGLTVAVAGCGKTNPDPSELCGNGVWDDGEECDAGDLNSDIGNCRTDCTLADDLEYRLAGWVLNEERLDAEGVADDEAPVGNGGWTVSETDINGDGLVKFELNLPAFDWSTLAGFDPALYPNAPADMPAPGAIAEIAVSEIAEISFQTKRDTSISGNFYLVLYTEPSITADGGPFYGSRLTAIPSQARMPNEVDATWTKWSTVDGENQLVFADQPVMGSFTGPTLPTLAELTATSTFDWSTVGPYPTTSIDYGSQHLLYISLQNSSSPPPPPASDFNALLDEIIIRTTDGRSITLDLEPRMSGGPSSP